MIRTFRNFDRAQAQASSKWSAQWKTSGWITSEIAKQRNGTYRTDGTYELQHSVSWAGDWDRWDI